jgi:macrophage erythroblast attacher
MVELEHSLIRVPYEQLARIFKASTRAIEKEISQVVTAITQLQKKKDTMTKEEAYNTFNKLSIKLQGLKRKVFIKFSLFFRMCSFTQKTQFDP